MLLQTFGLAFVASTRSTSFAVQAYRGLPPRIDFIAVRNSKKFEARVQFESKCADKHDESMRVLRDWNRIEEYEAHLDWWIRAKQDSSNVHMYEDGLTVLEGLVGLFGSLLLRHYCFAIGDPLAAPLAARRCGT